MTDLPTPVALGDGSSIVPTGPVSERAQNLRDQDFEAPTARAVGLGIAGLEVLSDLERADRLHRMREGTLGSVHSWELVTAVDGPGTRLTVFLNGCGLRCQYCHNPDTFLMKDGAPVSIEDILARIRRYRRIFRASGGGVTISGGEAMMQPEFVRRIFRGAKEMGVHTCLDTSGFLGVNCDDAMLDDIDLVLLDVKSGLPDTYRKVTGGELQPTIDFGDRLAARGTTRVWIRFVLVPDLTDAKENIEAIGRIISKWRNVIDRVEVLPFHQMGRDKWKSLGLHYTLDATQPPSVQATTEVRDHFRSLGFVVT
ncbi:pyruvate formate lyase-activating protein [Schaalia sp. 19OD2882]|uniref:pyruvate formate-lyase-activating protein n=1 Tax=Schaalia sp. 19OD2882 TaxID=2794089 RepID=UPI001C1EA35E|nr:pyruvate formate-lyase-activating protein [Schaalia sp. 19OD2882]QWW20348.1 pyruvate formate lyase-activating protein [Schaalia sp. 19OD2882]